MALPDHPEEGYQYPENQLILVLSLDLVWIVAHYHAGLLRFKPVTKVTNIIIDYEFENIHCMQNILCMLSFMQPHQCKYTAR